MPELHEGLGQVGDDLGQAIGSKLMLPDELVGPVFEMVKPFGDLTALGGGMFKPEKFLVAPVFSVHPTLQSIPVLEKAVGFGHRQWHGRGIQEFRR